MGESGILFFIFIVILIHCSVPFALQTCHTDKEGCYVLVHGTIYGDKITIVNIYAPNIQSSHFWTQIATEIGAFQCPLTIVTGHWASEINLPL